MKRPDAVQVFGAFLVLVALLGVLLVVRAVYPEALAFGGPARVALQRIDALEARVSALEAGPGANPDRTDER